MQNFYGSVPLGAHAAERLAQADDSSRMQNVQNTNTNNAELMRGGISKTYCDALRSLALTQINLGDKLKHCTIPIYNKC